ncbi:MAG: PDZ domain-containing protein [Acidobacteriota bacterium]
MRHSRLLSTALFCLLAMLPAAVPAAAAGDTGGLTRLLRFPDIHRDRIAFVYGGDLWIVASEGGLARRLTSHQGLELFPKFSPDGKWIAFSGEYGGTRQVYVISIDGGTPRQLTFYNDVGPMPPRGGFDNRVLGWTPDGTHVVFRANRLPWGVRMGRPYKVPVDGGLETPLGIPEGGGGDLSPDGRRMAYTPIDREFRTWKRYRGGRAQDVWIYDLKNGRARPLTHDPGTDNQPVWVGDTIYFTSDREPSRKLNLYAVDPASGAIQPVTHHEEYDVLWPSGGPESVVYENGGFICRYDPAHDQSVRVPIRVSGDRPDAYPVLKNVQDWITSAEISPSGARALMDARGDVFTVPAENGAIRNITNSQGVREMSPVWSPDGGWIAYLSDRSGEYEIALRHQDGSGEERRLTTDGDIWRFPPVWSPDSQKIAFADKKQRLRYVEVESGRVVDVDHSDTNDITTYVWSPDSRWLAYTKTASNQMMVIWLYSVEGRHAQVLTSPLVSNFDPVFDPGGRYLYFLSNRDFNLTFSSWEFSYVYTGPTRIYAGTLNQDIPLPFRPKTDEEKPHGGEGTSGEASADETPAGDRAAAGTRGDQDQKETRTHGVQPVTIQIDGFDNRVVALPGSSGRYRRLQATPDGVLYLNQPGTSGPATLKFFDMKKEEEKTILEKISGYAVSADGKKILYTTGKEYGIVDNQAGKKNTEGRLKLETLEMKIDPRAEWAQIFDDAWRILRDWFYDPGMHGVDWPGMRERYGALVPFVAHRADLDAILGELGGELSSSHVYVQSGDQKAVKRQDGGLLGAELTAHRSGRYRITKIFPGENWHPDFRSPLTEPGVSVKEGDFLLAIDGRQVTTRDNPYRFLDGKAGHLVTLTVNDRPDQDGSRQETVRPIARETNLRYLDWVLERRRRVEKASGGRIGYIHIPDTAVNGNRELFKYFYPQSDADALIIDDRYNGGGFIPDRMIELLDRPRLNYWVRRGIRPEPTPVFSHEGPKVCLINGYSSSGGDAFPYYFRKRGLGLLIGTRTWGGLIGISGNPSLVDGGAVLAPTFRFLATDGQWAVENEGVKPDIEVVDRPDQVARGRDPSLEKAIQVLLDELERHPPRHIKVPPTPAP